MIYIGMDISSKSFMVHAIDQRKKIVFNKQIAPTRSGLRKMIEKLGKQTKLVVFEAGNQLKWVALTLKNIPGVHIHVVHPNEIKWINQSSAKTDKIDAKILAHLARADMLPRKVHIAEGQARELRELISARHTLQSKRVALINSMRGMLKQEGYKLPEKFFQSSNWQDKLSRMRVGETQRLILFSFMQSVENLAESEMKITQTIVEFEN